MKAMDIIDRLDGLEPNQYSPEQKLRWLSILDGKIYEEVLRPREAEPKGFTEYVNGNEELLVPFPYGDDVYLNYLQAMVALENAETQRYNKRLQFFNNAYAGYYNYPWDCVLRYTGAEEPETERAAEHVSVELPVLQRGSTGETVRAMQILLRGRGFGVGWYGADGEFGAATEEGLRAFQRVKTEETDGVCGERTWSRLLKG